MVKIGKIRPEQLRTARRILRELPVKDTRCSCEEAAAFLEKDLKRAFRKGYTPKELSLPYPIHDTKDKLVFPVVVEG